MINAALFGKKEDVVYQHTSTYCVITIWWWCAYGGWVGESYVLNISAAQVISSLNTQRKFYYLLFFMRCAYPNLSADCFRCQFRPSVYRIYTLNNNYTVCSIGFRSTPYVLSCSLKTGITAVVIHDYCVLLRIGNNITTWLIIITTVTGITSEVV